MKDSIMFSGFSAGIALIIIGCLLLIKSLFGIQVPLFRIIIGCSLIYGGIMLITTIRLSSSNKNPFQEDILFGYKRIDVIGLEAHPKKSVYNTVFGTLILDLHKMTLDQLPRSLKIHTVFGNTEIIVPADTSVTLKITNFCGNTDYPLGSHAGFGTKIIQLGDTTQPLSIIIEADTVFASLSVTQEAA